MNGRDGTGWDGMGEKKKEESSLSALFAADGQRGCEVSLIEWVARGVDLRAVRKERREEGASTANRDWRRGCQRRRV